MTSPAGTAWWRNVEMTGYYRYTAAMDGFGQLRHVGFLARGERHSERMISGDAINSGVPAPSGTATWPGYPYGVQLLNPHCLGTSYHGSFYLEPSRLGRALFEKEISHYTGYSPQRAQTTVSPFADALNRWFGLKFIVRNAESNTRVHLELWLDTICQWRLADGVFIR